HRLRAAIAQLVGDDHRRQVLRRLERWNDAVGELLPQQSRQRRATADAAGPVACRQAPGDLDRGHREAESHMRPRSGEGGFTLPEMLIAISILGIIVGPLVLSLVSGLRVVGRVDERFTDSRSSLISAAYFANDVASASTVTVGGAACGGGTAVISF